MKKILLAGATGYLGRYILDELGKENFECRAVIRDKSTIKKLPGDKPEIIRAEVTQPETLKDICNGIDTVISTVGITKQKDGLTYMDVDYAANRNLLNEGVKSGVKKFIYVSVLNGEKLKNLKICAAKERFVEELKNTGIDYCIIRPNGFFSDISEFFTMAKKGTVYLFGGGEFKSNPVHGEDLAKIIVQNIETHAKEIEIGGPEILTQNQIAELAFNALGQKKKIIHIPDWIRKLTLRIVRLFTGSKTYGPIEFFMTVMGMEMIAPEFGIHTLKEYFENLAEL